MAFRGRGRGRGGFGGVGGGFRIAKQVPFELFPEVEELGTAVGVGEKLSLAIWYSKFQKFSNSSPYYVEEENRSTTENQGTEIERFSNRISGKSRIKQPLSHFIRMEPGYVPTELLAKGGKKDRHSRKRVRWNPEQDMKKLDIFEKLDEKNQEVDEKEDEEEEEDNKAEEEEEYSDDGDYNQNIDFDDDEDDFNMDDDNDDEPIF